VPPTLTRPPLNATEPDSQLSWFAETLRKVDELRVELIVRLAEAALRTQQPAKALELARRVARHDPYDEVSCALAMRALAALNDRAGARREFAAYCERLERELGAKPSPTLAVLAAGVDAG
jgi:two-component SAPR family response regulator